MPLCIKNNHTPSLRYGKQWDEYQTESCWTALVACCQKGLCTYSCSMQCLLNLFVSSVCYSNSKNKQQLGSGKEGEPQHEWSGVMIWGRIVTDLRKISKWSHCKAIEERFFHLCKAPERQLYELRFSTKEREMSMSGLQTWILGWMWCCLSHAGGRFSSWRRTYVPGKSGCQGLLYLPLLFLYLCLSSCCHLT